VLHLEESLCSKNEVLSGKTLLLKRKSRRLALFYQRRQFSFERFGYRDVAWEEIKKFSGKCHVLHISELQRTSVNPDSIWPTILSGLGKDPDDPKVLVFRLTSSKCWDVGENHLNWTHLRPNSRLSQKQKNLLVYVHWYSRLVTAISRQLWTILST